MNRLAIGRILIAGGLILALGIVMAAAANVTPIPVDDSSSPSIAVCYVIGDVQFPGAFEFQSSPLFVRTLLKRAGGLTSPDGSCVIKIVRSGRVVHHADYQSTKQATPCRLKSGDVVIAATKQSQFPTTTAPKKPAPRADATYIGLVGVLDAPIILPLFSSHVTLGQLLAELHQAPATANRIQIITGGDQSARRPVGQALRRLANGTVLVFDPQDVNFGNLPKIPTVAAMPDRAAANVQLASQENAEPPTGPELLAQPLVQLDQPRAVDVDRAVNEPAEAELAMADDLAVEAASPVAVAKVDATTAEPPNASGPNSWTPVIGVLLIVIGLIWMLRDQRHSVSRWLVRVQGKSAIARTARKVPVLMTIRTVAHEKMSGIRRLPSNRDTTMHRAGKLVHRVLFRVARQRD